MKPKVIVELGTHYGDSYCAFCQAVQELSLETHCYAVDTWTGDPHTGSYGPEVLADLRAHHDPLYGGFSRLIQSTFDEARSHFKPATIALLHIDGYHTYEQVKHDFETWLPAMIPHGVVLWHDINVLEANFGIQRFWSEIKSNYPHFEFENGHGLGVMCVGNKPTEELRHLFEAAEEDVQTIRDVFSELGRRLVLRRSQMQLFVQLIVERNLQGQKVDSLLATIERQQLALAQSEEQINQLQKEVRKEKALNEQLTVEIMQFRNTLISIYSGLVWRLWRSYGKVKEIFVPYGSVRRKTYDFILRSVKGGFGLQRLTNCLVPVNSKRRRFFYFVKESLVFLCKQGLKSFGKRAIRKIKRHVKYGEPLIVEPSHLWDLNAQYNAWLKTNGWHDEDAIEMLKRVKQFNYQPRISVIMPVYNTDEKYLKKAIKSVLLQIYPNWELCLVNDGSTEPRVSKVLKSCASKNQQVKILMLEKNGGVSFATNKGIEMATGEFIVLLDHDDELAPHALFEVINLLHQNPNLDLIYSDEDKIEIDGSYVEPFFKPDWSPDLLMSMNYICHMSIYRKSLVEEIGGFRSPFDGSQDHDLLLRISEKTDRIAHIPKILYHWRKIPSSTADSLGAKPRAIEAGRLALEEALHRRMLLGRMEVYERGLYRARYSILGDPLISIIIPTRDKVELLQQCISGIERKTTYRHLELLIIDNGSTEERTLNYLRVIAKRHRVLPFQKPFNYAAVNNFAASQACGDYLLFLNNDVEVISSEWLEAMLEQAQRAKVGIVGAKLLYPSNRIQHAGVVIGLGGVAGHAFKHLPADDPGYFYLPKVIRNCSAVTGACLMVRQKVFEEVAGFDERIHVAFNDVDFCLRVRVQGYLVIYTPFALLYHHESATRGTLHPLEDEQFVRDRWADLMKKTDPYYNPNLTLDYEDYRLRL